MNLNVRLVVLILERLNSLLVEDGHVLGHWVLGFDLQVVVKVRVERESLFEGRDARIRASERVASVFDEVVTGVEALELRTSTLELKSS